MKKIILSALITGVSCLQLSAQEPWSLKQCIDYATEHNINVRQQILKQKNQELEVNTTKWSRLPNLGAGAGQNFYFGRGPGRDGTYRDQSQSSSSLDISTSVSLFNGLRTWNQLNARKFDLEAAIEDLNKAKEDLALNITAYYLQVLFNKELRQIAEDQVQLTTSQLQKTEVLVKSGKTPESELYESRANLAKEEVNLTDADNALKLSLLDLSQLLNLDSLENFDIQTPDIETLALTDALKLMNPEEVFTQSVENRPAVRAAQQRLQSSLQELKVSKAAFYPSLSLSASYSNSFFHTYNLDEGQSNTSFSEQVKQNGSETVGLKLSIPIFNRLATRNQVRASRIEIESRELVLEETRQTLFKEIQQAFYNAVAAHDKFRSSRKSVEASQLALQYEEQKYNAGKSTVFQFNEVKTRLAKSMSDLAQAKYDFVFRSRILDFYKGLPLY